MTEKRPTFYIEPRKLDSWDSFLIALAELPTRHKKLLGWGCVAVASGLAALGFGAGLAFTAAAVAVPMAVGGYRALTHSSSPFIESSPYKGWTRPARNRFEAFFRAAQHQPVVERVEPRTSPFIESGPLKGCSYLALSELRRGVRAPRR